MKKRGSTTFPNKDEKDITIESVKEWKEFLDSVGCSTHTSIAFDNDLNVKIYFDSESDARSAMAAFMGTSPHVRVGGIYVDDHHSEFYSYCFADHRTNATYVLSVYRKSIQGDLGYGEV